MNTIDDFAIESAEWKKSFHAAGKIDPWKAHASLLKIQQTHGEITDDHIVDAAAAKRHPLHAAFDWDDTSAAREYRRRQAQQLLQCLQIVYKQRPKKPARAFEVTRKSSRSSAKRTIYGTHEDAMKDPVAREQLLADAIRQLMAWRRRFKDLNEFDRLMPVIDEMVDEFAGD